MIRLNCSSVTCRGLKTPATAIGIELSPYSGDVLEVLPHCSQHAWWGKCAQCGRDPHFGVAVFFWDDGSERPLCHYCKAGGRLH